MSEEILNMCKCPRVCYELATFDVTFQRHLPQTAHVCAVFDFSLCWASTSCILKDANRPYSFQEQIRMCVTQKVTNHYDCVIDHLLDPRLIFAHSYRSDSIVTSFKYYLLSQAKTLNIFFISAQSYGEI